jgi:pre-mRNA-splicing helicase BRR2
LYYFDSSYRPIPLEQVYIGITEKKGIRKMLLANEIMYEKVIERAGKCQMIIFVHSRRETIKVAQLLKEMAYSKDELGRFKYNNLKVPKGKFSQLDHFAVRNC